MKKISDYLFFIKEFMWIFIIPPILVSLPSTILYPFLKDINIKIYVYFVVFWFLANILIYLVAFVFFFIKEKKLALLQRENIVDTNHKKFLKLVFENALDGALELGWKIFMGLSLPTTFIFFPFATFLKLSDRSVYSLAEKLRELLL